MADPLKVPQPAFDAVLSRLIAAPPSPKAAIDAEIEATGRARPTRKAKPTPPAPAPPDRP